MEVTDLPAKEFKVIVIKTLTEQRRRMNELSENFKKGIELQKKNQLKNTVTSTQYSVMACMGKESKKEWMYVYV